MADVPCLDHSLDVCKGYPDDVQTTKHATNAHMVEMHANLSWRTREPVWRLERPFLNRDARDERANRRTEHGEQPIYQIKHS